MRGFRRDVDNAESPLSPSELASEALEGAGWLRLRAVIVPRGSRPGEIAPSSCAEPPARQESAPECRFWSLNEALAAYGRVHDAMWRHVLGHAPVRTQDTAAAVGTGPVGEAGKVGRQKALGRDHGAHPRGHTHAAARRPPAKGNLRPPRRPGPNDNMHVSSHGEDLIFTEETRGNLDVTAHPHAPGKRSGVTLGPGYDMRFRSPEQIIKDLQQIGVGIDQARVLSAAGKRGPGSKDLGVEGWEAKKFADLHKASVTLTEAQQRSLLRIVLPQYEGEVRQIIHVSLNQNEFDALVSFDFARGRRNLAKAGQRIQAGDRLGAAEFIRHLDDKRDIGLVRRRGAEADLFLLSSSKGKSPEGGQ